jgi:hypothetical protein
MEQSNSKGGKYKDNLNKQDKNKLTVKLKIQIKKLEKEKIKEARGGEERYVKWLLGYLDENRSQGGQSLLVKQGVENNGRKMYGM